MPDPVPATYTAFGAMAVTVDGSRHVLTRGRDRGVLAVLLAAHGAAVPAERIVTEVWGADAPPTALGMLQVSVSRLRSVLEPDRSSRAGTRLVSTAAGYAVHADPLDVDTWAFETAAAAVTTASSPEETQARVDEAERWWTGDPYAGCTAPTVLAEAERLRELRLVVQEARARALLDSARPADAVLLLSPLAPTEPYREGLWCLLALAQYQSARQAEALETLRTLRSRLAEDLGVDPSEQAQQLERAVLAQDLSIAADAPATPAPAPDLTSGPGQPVAAPHPPAGPTATAGRDEVTSAARSVLDAAVAKERLHFLSVSGEAGIGKTRLISDLSLLATEAGFDVLVGRCLEGDYAPALWPWVTIVRGLPGADQVPELAPLLGGEATDLSGGSGMRMFDAVVDLLVASARHQPLLLVLEDIHWADATSLELLRHLATTAPAAPLVVVTTRRTADGHPVEHLIDTMAALARAGGERLPLDGLDDTAVGRLLVEAVGDHDPRLDAHVAEVTGGNPFFVLQYARLLQGLSDLDSVDPASLPVPEGVREVLAQRIHRLPEPTQATLANAAVLGPYVDPDLLGELSGEPVGRLLDQLDQAVTAGLLEERGAGYAFVHALARDAMAATLSAARQMRVHDAAAAVLEARLGDDPDSAAIIAHHAHQAAPLGVAQTERATRWLARAARLAASRHAHAEALSLWQQALTDAPAGSEAAYDAHCGQAAAMLRLARTTQARSEIQAAARLARSLGLSDLVADAVSVLHGAGVWSWREHGTRDQAFIDLLTEAAEGAAPRDEARLLATLEMELAYALDPAAAQVGARAVELARRSDDEAVLQEVLLLHSLSRWEPGGAETRLGLLQELLGLEPVGEARAVVLFRLGGTLFDCGRTEEADAVMAECSAEAASLRHTGVEIPLAWWHVARARDRDDPAAADLARAALQLHRGSGYLGSPELESLAEVRLLPPGAPVPDTVVERVRDATAVIRAIPAVALLEAGDPDAAVVLLGPAPPVGANDYGLLAALCLRVLVLAETGPRDALAEAVERLEPYAGTVAVYGTVDHLGAVDYFCALGHRALGDDSRAAAEAAAAVELTAATGVLPWHRKAVALLESLRSAG